MTLDRRTFIKRMGLAGGATLAAGALAGCEWWVDWPGSGAAGSILDWPASEAPVDHVVVVMMENRSFDHYLGWLATDEAYLDAGRARYGAGFSVDGDQTQTFLDPAGTPVSTEHLFAQAGQSNPWRGCGFRDPGHSWTAGRAQRDGGFLATGANNDQFALGYYLEDDIPLVARLAQRFTAFDRYHCSILGPTYPNRAYLHSGQSGGLKNNQIPAGGYTWPTIWDRLSAASVPCRYYSSDLPLLGLWGVNGLVHNSPIADYYTACAAGSLPNVTFLDPKFLEPGREDDHPHADVRAGQRFLQRTFKAFVDSPHWERGVFIVTYDEWGGFFDHVAPPRLIDDRASTVDVDDFARAGFRVPTVMASPYARPGFVDHRVYDHTSILRFLEWRFLGAPFEGGLSGSGWWLTARDRFASNIGASLARELVDAEPGFDIDAPIGAPSPECLPAAGAGGALAAAAVPVPGEPEAFDEAVWHEHLDRIGAAALLG